MSRRAVIALLKFVGLVDNVALLSPSGLADLKEHPSQRLQSPSPNGQCPIIGDAFQKVHSS